MWETVVLVYSTKIIFNKYKFNYFLVRVTGVLKNYFLLCLSNLCKTCFISELFSLPSFIETKATGKVFEFEAAHPEWNEWAEFRLISKNICCVLVFIAKKSSLRTAKDWFSPFNPLAMYLHPQEDITLLKNPVMELIFRKKKSALE